MVVYVLFKFIHVAAAIVWIGGVLTLGVLQARLARTQDRTVLMALSRQSEFFSKAILGPAAGITLIAGIVMVATSGLGAQLWITWGFVGLLASMALGGGFIRRVGKKLNTLVANGALEDPHVRTLQKRLSLLNAVNVLLLLSVVWAMVFKPTL